VHEQRRSSEQLMQAEASMALSSRHASGDSRRRQWGRTGSRCLPCFVASRATRKRDSPWTCVCTARRDAGGGGTGRTRRSRSRSSSVSSPMSLCSLFRASTGLSAQRIPLRIARHALCRTLSTSALSKPHFVTTPIFYVNAGLSKL
jgi:hypothetical protein